MCLNCSRSVRPERARPCKKAAWVWATDAGKRPRIVHPVYPTEPTLWYALGMSTVSYLDRFLNPLPTRSHRSLHVRLVDLRADDELQAEIDVLRQKANRGTLSPEEESAYKDFVEAIDVISIIQSKARRFLARHPA